MPRTLSAQTEHALSLPVTEPHYLVYIAFDIPLYLSSKQDFAWNGHVWQKADLVIRALNPDKRTGEVAIGNTDLAIGQKILSEGIADRAIEVYEIHGSNPDDGELLFRGYGGGCTVDARWAVIRLRWIQQASMFSPRIIACRDTGFNHLPPAGSKISWDGVVYVLNRRG